MRRRLALSATVAVAALLAFGSPVALAFPPDVHGPGGEDGVDTLAAPDPCSFDVQIHYHSTGQSWTFYDRTGSYPVKYIEHRVAQDSFTANGVTLAGDPYRYTLILTFDAAGNITSAVVMGGIERVPLPGGQVFWSVGRYDIYAHDFTGGLVPDVGHSGDIAAFCAALAP